MFSNIFKSLHNSRYLIALIEEDSFQDIKSSDPRLQTTSTDPAFWTSAEALQVSTNWTLLHFQQFF